jgi:hypothetical protein
LLAAAWHRAAGVVGLDALVHPRQVCRQGFSLGLVAWRFVRRSAACGGAQLQRGELGLQARLVGGTRLIEVRARLGVHGFGFGAELPGLQPGERDGDAPGLRLASLEGLGPRVDALAVRADLFARLTDGGQHVLSYSGQCIGARTAQVLGFEAAQIEPVHSVPSPL